MTQGGLLQSSKKYLPWIAMALLTLLVLLSPKAYAADSGGGRACDSGRPSPYTNGAPIVRVFYPADGSTITVTSTGAVIKQSPCQTPYREGWINPAKICDLNSFDDLGGMINKTDNNPNPNTDPVYTCSTSAPVTTASPAPVVSSVQTTVNTTSAPVRPTETPSPTPPASNPSPAP